MITGFFGYFVLQIVLVLVGVAKLFAYRRAGANVHPVERTNWPAISVVSSVKGISSGLADGLRTLWTQDYPGALEIVFIVEDSNDPAHAEIARLVSSFGAVPDRSVRVITGRPVEGPNPRNRKMVYGFGEARNEWIFWHAIDTLFASDFLRQCVRVTNGDHKTYVSGFPMNFGSEDFGARLETVSLNLEVSRFFLLTFGNQKRGPLYGGAIFAHRSLFEESGMLKIIPFRLAEDIVFANAFAKLGARRHVTSRPVFVRAERQSFAAFWNRQVRWMMIARHHMKPEFFLGLFGFVTPIYLLLALALQSTALLEMALAFQLLRIAYAALTLVVLRTPGRDAWNALLLPIYDLLIPAIWFAALVKKQVVWAGETMEVWPDGSLRIIPRT